MLAAGKSSSRGGEVQLQDSRVSRLIAPAKNDRIAWIIEHEELRAAAQRSGARLSPRMNGGQVDQTSIDKNRNADRRAFDSRDDAGQFPDRGLSQRRGRRGDEEDQLSAAVATQVVDDCARKEWRRTRKSLRIALSVPIAHGTRITVVLH
jgi:hypothetical protein